jgi:FtsZ-interacting cell division protein ZipA
MNTIAYQPVVIAGKNFLTLYIGAQDTLTSDVSTLIDQQKYITILIVTVIGGVAFIIAFLLFSWNRRLQTTVNVRTAELKRANDSLTESNKQLAAANEQLKIHDKMQKEFINIARIFQFNRTTSRPNRRNDRGNIQKCHKTSKTYQ